jgi:hypothetical protein
VTSQRFDQLLARSSLGRGLDNIRRNGIEAELADLERDLKPANMRRRRRAANLNGGSKDPARGMYCTPKWIADIVGAWDLDPFSNPRSHIVSTERCMLEDGGDGLLDPRRPGSYRRSGDHVELVAGANKRVWLQPPYEIVDEALAHYGHTRFCALLRFDPSTNWFQKLYRLTRLVCVPRRKRINFEPPPGVTVSENSYPHALYYARPEDATEQVLRRCIAWRTR